MLIDFEALILHQFSQILRVKCIESVTLKGIEWKNEILISKINATLFMYNYLCFLEILFSLFHEDILSSICLSSRETTNTKTDNGPSLRKELNTRFYF